MSITEREIQEFALSFMSFGYLDVERALTIIKESGIKESLAELIDNFAESTGLEDKTNVDVVDVVYSEILNVARTELEELVNYDLLNDNNGSIYVASNYVCTSYDYDNEDIESIKEKLKENEIDINDLTVTTQWFLSELEID